VGVKLNLWVLLVFLVGCAQGHCRHPADAPAGAQPLPTAQDSGVKDKDSDEHVFVYKYDGSLQCGMGKPVSVETMAKELQGIPIVSMLKKSDGLMHIQVCGSISGKANVYEIPTSYQKQAEGKGFKKWSFE
jgi:hypothetical protein